MQYVDRNTVVINLPLDYASNEPIQYKYGYWYLIDGFKTLRFDLGQINESLHPGDGGSSTDQPNVDSMPPIPVGLRYRQLYNNAIILDWEEGENQ